MNAGTMTPAGANPFSPRAVLALVVFGALVFVALLWMIGAGMTSGSANDGGAHAGSKGLTGYAGAAAFLERRGFGVRLSRSEATFGDPGVLVLTPPADAKGEDLAEIAGRRRAIGPTIVILPKWMATQVSPTTAGAKEGWTQIIGLRPPQWSGFHDDLSVAMAASARWNAGGLSGRLPDPAKVQSGSGSALVPLVTDDSGRMLAAYVDDGAMYPALEDIALSPPHSEADDERAYPLVFVFEPDLLNNQGLADRNNALLAERLMRAARKSAAPGAQGAAINFDLTQSGHAHSANLLTLAFTPPFLAATLCLLMAALIAGWRAFLRFGPARQGGRAIAFGKTALVGNTAGLMRRTRRLHLIAVPYADAARERLAAALALPQGRDPGETDAAIDRALAARAAQGPRFSALAESLRRARRPADILKAAQALHALERTLIR